MKRLGELVHVANEMLVSRVIAGVQIVEDAALCRCATWHSQRKTSSIWEAQNLRLGQLLLYKIENGMSGWPARQVWAYEQNQSFLGRWSPRHEVHLYVRLQWPSFFVLLWSLEIGELRDPVLVGLDRSSCLNPFLCN